MDFLGVVNTSMNKKLLKMKTGNRLTQSGKVSVFSEGSLNVAKYQNTYEAITLAIKTKEHEKEGATNFPDPLVHMESITCTCTTQNCT